MSEVLTLKANASALISEEAGYLNFNDHSSSTAVLDDERLLKLLCSLPALTGGNQFKEVLGASAWVYCGINNTAVASALFCSALAAKFNPEIVNGANYSSYNPSSAARDISINGAEGNAYRAAELNVAEALAAMKYGLCFDAASEGVYYATRVQTAYGSNPPKLELSLGDVQGANVARQLPEAGSSLNYKKNCDFRFTYSVSKATAEAVVLTGAELQWRVAGDSSTSSIVLSAKELAAGELIVPGGTFPTGDIEYRFALTANSGAVTYGNWTTLTTPAAEVFSYSPASGARLNRLKSNFFQCLIRATPEGNSTFLDGQSGGLMRWRLDGGEIKEVSLTSPSYNSVLLPGGTLPSGSIEYQLSIIDELGRTVETPWVTVSTVDTISKARAMSPQGTVEDGERPIRLVWEHINESGTLPTRSEIQTAKVGESFTTLAIINGNATEYEAPAGTFSSGQWQWRARTYNIDEAVGVWSEAAEFVVVASPQTPVLVLEDSSPRAVVRWQTNEQEGYELELDGASLGTRFGTGQRWKSPDYLRDGEHSLRVRVQNTYGLWSDWGMIIFSVRNEPGGEIKLTARGRSEASLSWEAEGYDFYVVYKNGVPVGKTSEKHWIDYCAIDEISYQVKGGFEASGNYGESNEVKLTVLPETIVINAVYNLGKKEWQTLRLSQTQYRAIKSSKSRQVNRLQLNGYRYPLAEPEEHYGLSLSVSCAFSSRAEGRALEELAGKLVCVKTPGGEMAIGYLENLQKSSQEFYASYSFSVEHLEAEEAIELDA